MATVFTSTKALTPVGAKTAKTPTLKSPAPSRAPFHARTVSNGCTVRQMMTWTPNNNKYFETLSYLPPLTSDQIAKQVDYMVNNGWTPCLEFANPKFAYIESIYNNRLGSVSSNYIDNRYWTMWKLPMFGCKESSQVLTEISNCEKTFPGHFIRLAAFDAVRQVQIAGFLVLRPKSDDSYVKDVGKRSI